MKIIGWLATLGLGVFLFSSFKKETTIPGGTNTDQSFSPPKKGFTNKDVTTVVTYSPPENSRVLQKPDEKITLKKGTELSLVSYNATGGYYVFTYGGYGFGKVMKDDVTFETSYNPIDVIDYIIRPPDFETSNNDVTGGGGGGTPSGGSGGGGGGSVQEAQLPADEFTPYSPVKTGKALHDIPGINNLPYIKKGDFVNVTGYRKHYAFTAKNELVFTNLYQVQIGLQLRDVQMEAIQITSTTPASTNVEGYTGLEKYNPARTGKVNKTTTFYKPNGTEIQAAQGTLIAVSGKGYVRTNRFGTWENIPVYDANMYGTRVLARITDVNI